MQHFSSPQTTRESKWSYFHFAVGEPRAQTLNDLPKVIQELWNAATAGTRASNIHLALGLTLSHVSPGLTLSNVCADTNQLSLKVI